jgi:hypothetical protein
MTAVRDLVNLQNSWNKISFKVAAVRKMVGVFQISSVRVETNFLRFWQPNSGGQASKPASSR